MLNRFTIATINVATGGQRIHRQIKLPKDAGKIVSVHATVSIKTELNDNIFPPLEFAEGVYFFSNIVAGDLRLQSFDKAGWFYNNNVTLDDRNWHFGDFPTFTFPTPYTHAHYNHIPVEVAVDGDTTLLNLYYKDVWGWRFETDIEYDVNIYIETTTK